jgi:Uncharacterised nucleotidyltransferase
MSFADPRGAAFDAIELAARRARAEFALARVLSALDAEGIPAIPVKGIVTGRWLYRSAHERPMSDVDLRVRSGDRRGVLALAERHRWPIQQRSALYRSVTFVVEDTPFDVECAVGAPAMCSLSVEAMLSRARRTREGLRCEHYRAETHDHALLLAMNVLKDQVGRSFPWAIEDLVRVATVADFSPSILGERAWRAGAASALLAIARWLASAHDSAPWRAVADAVGAPPRPRYVRALERALDPGGSPRISALRTLLARRSNDLYSMRILSISAAAIFVPWAVGERLVLGAVERRARREQHRPRP